MKYIWSKEIKKNTVLEFFINISNDCDTLRISAVDFYQVFLDGTLVAFGPSRTASGYSRPKCVDIFGVNNVLIKVNYYGVPTYACDLQSPFFGAEILKKGKVVFTTDDFKCQKNLSKKEAVPRYSYQHGFLEVYDLTINEQKDIETIRVKPPTMLEEQADTCLYNTIGISKKDGGYFSGFNRTTTPWWANGEKPENMAFDVGFDFIKETEFGYKYIDYALDCEKTGFICLKLNAKEQCKVFLAFEEVLVDGEWVFGRNQCYNFISLKIDSGNTQFISLEPYSFKYLKIIYNGDIDITPSLIAVENDKVDLKFSCADNDLNLIYNAAKESFCQNAFDVFTDCPSRERAGWLCDSFFLGKAEKYFTGTNVIERAFLENYILANTPEIEDGMLPKCFPAEHKDAVYIPNWAMWYILELKDYFVRSNDKDLVEKARGKVYKIINYFDKYLNTDGLLENLKSWVFVDYGDSNTYPYLYGVNYPSNMLYAYMLDSVDYLYGDTALKKRAAKIRKTIVKQAFNGKFFIENAVRINGKLLPCNDHITEAAQYYALFTDTYNESGFRKRVKTGLGPLNNIDYPFVSRSNGFVGIYLRLLWLDSMCESERLIKEIKDYFLHMAKTTGTLWEYDSPQASCNHGFTSIIAVLIDKNYI